MYNTHLMTNNGSIQSIGGNNKMMQNTTTPPKTQSALHPSNLNGINNSLNINSNKQSQFPISYRKNYDDPNSIPMINNNNNNMRNNSITERENYFDSNMNNPYKNYSSNQVNQVSPNLLMKKFEREQEDFIRLSLEEINRELDINMNEIIVMLNRRKHLILVKRQKLKDEYLEQIDLMKRQSAEDLQRDINRSSLEDNIIQNIANNTDSFAKMKQIVQNVTKDINSNTHEKQKLEITRSADFWATNKNYEDEVDALLQKLKIYDSELEKCNYQIQEVCRNLDSMEEQIKILLLTKDEDHLLRAEPVFNQKQRFHEQLNHQNSQRNKIKDEKIHIITRIIDFLSDLKSLRSERLQDLAELFGIDENSDSSVKIQYYIDFVEHLENIAKLKDNLLQAEIQEEPIQMNIDRLYKENDQLFSELIKKQSEEAKSYADLSENLVKRLNMHRAIELFMNQANLNNINHLDIRDLLKKFKENILFLKPLVEEDVALRQGYNKTYETINTFSNILLAIETEKERRKELVVRLEQCIRLKQDGDIKTEDLRNVEMEITKKLQQKRNLEEDLDHILSDADLEEYKRIGVQIRTLDKDAQDLNVKRTRVQKDVDSIQQQVVLRINQIRTDYDDIMKEVISNDVINNYDFKNANDIKQVKNLLKKTFKRLGMTFEEPRNLSSVN